MQIVPETREGQVKLGPGDWEEFVIAPQQPFCDQVAITDTLRIAEQKIAKPVGP